MRARHAVAVMVVLLGGFSPARAGFVTYTFSGIGNGQDSGQAFINTAFTLTVTSDTSLITPFSFTRNGTVNNGFSITPSTTSFSVGGLFPIYPSGTFIGGEKVFVNNSTHVVGLQMPSNSDLLDLQVAPPFDTYDLQSSIGPVTVASPAYLDFNFQQTTVGTFSLFSASNISFTANVIPEPASVVMLGLGLIGLIGVGAATGYRSPRRALIG